MQKHKLLKRTIYVFLFLWINTIQGQDIIFHNEAISRISCDSIGQIWIQDEKGEIFQLVDKKLVKSEWKSLNLKLWQNKYQKVIIGNGPFLYTLVQKKLKTIRTDNDNILFATACANGAISFINNYQISFILDDELKSCNTTIPGDSILSIDHVDDMYFALTRNDIHELCSDLEISFSNGLEFSSICPINSSELLIGTTNFGLWIFKNDNFKQLYVPGIKFPEKIKKLSKSNSNLLIKDSLDLLYRYEWDNQVIEVVDENVTDFVFDRWNTLWYSKGNQLIKNNKFINDEIPVIRFNKLESNYKTIDHLSKIPFENAKNGIAIFTESYYSPAQEELKFFYSVNKGAKWLTNGSSNIILLDKLQAGSHDIWIKSSANGVHFSSPVQLKIEVAAKFVRSIWFYLLLGIILLSTIALIALWINKSNKIKWDKERQKIKLELDLVKQQQKLGQLQLNPHFLFNSLNSISGLIALKDNANARIYLNQFSQMMRSLLNQSLEDSILLSEEIDFLERYLELEKMINNGKFEFTIKNNTTIDQRIPMMLLQPFVENSILHGIKPKAEKGRISISFAEAEKHILVKITDNGVGRRSSGINKNDNHISSALKIIGERLRKLDKWYREDHIIFEDLIDENNNPKGTSVSIYVPKIY